MAKPRNKDNRKHIRNSRQNGSLVMAADDVAAEAGMKENATAKREKLEMASIEKAEFAKMKPEACNRFGFF